MVNIITLKKIMILLVGIFIDVWEIIVRKIKLIILVVIIILLGVACSSDVQIESFNQNNQNGSVQINYGQLNDLNDKTLNDVYSHDERVEMTLDYIESLLDLLKDEITLQLSDAELVEKLDNAIVSNSKMFSGGLIRIVRYDGSAELFGTLERRWLIAQWRDKDGACVQLLADKDAQIVREIIILESDGVVKLFLGGYLTTYKPYPVFVSSWRLEDGKWIKSDDFSSVGYNKEGFSVYDNILIYENVKKQEITIDENLTGDGFVFSSTRLNKNIFEIIFLENEIINRY